MKFPQVLKYFWRFFSSIYSISDIFLSPPNPDELCELFDWLRASVSLVDLGPPKLAFMVVPSRLKMLFSTAKSIE
jgi:hypothetical protein